MEEESSFPPLHASPTPIHTPHSSYPDHYTFSQEFSYNSDEDDVNEEEEDDDVVTSSALNPPPPPPKRPKLSPSTTTTTTDPNPDQISTLPDFLLLHILSFLPAESAVATGALSKRWRHLWTTVPTLLFRHRGLWANRILEFVDFVSRTLLFYGCSKVKKFDLDFDFDKCFQSQVHGWLRFATRHDVEELNLNFDGDEDMFGGEDCYTLPQFIYGYGGLKKLSLRFCVIVPKNGLISWKLLKNLSISYVALGDYVIEIILSGSPVLETLEFYKCRGIVHLDVKSESLRKLVVNDYWDCADTEEDLELEISGPNLQSLSILGFLYGKHCRVRNVSSLVDVTLNFQLLTEVEVVFDHNDYEEHQNMLREILENIHHVKKLTMGKWCIQVLSMCEMRFLPSPVSKRNYLILDTCLKSWESWDVPGIVSLLHSSPDLETLIINMTSPCTTEFEFSGNASRTNGFNVEKYLSLQNKNFKNSLLSLKTIELVGFMAGGKCSYFVIALLEFLLKNARALERMVICAQTRHIIQCMLPRPDDLHIVGQRLLNFPRSSPYAEIIFRDMKDSYQ